MLLEQAEELRMPEYRVRRDGQQYLVFSGHVVAEASDRFRHGREQDRWTDIRVYRTDTGSYVVEQVLRTLWQKGDAVWYQGDLCVTPQEVYRALVGSEADGILGDLEKHLLHQLAAQDPRFTELIEERDSSQD
jgi:EXLDI family protein